MEIYYSYIIYIIILSTKDMMSLYLFNNRISNDTNIDYIIALKKVLLAFLCDNNIFSFFFRIKSRQLCQYYKSLKNIK